MDQERQHLTDIGITGGGKGNNMLYLKGVQTEKILSNDDIVSKVVEFSRKKSFKKYKIQFNDSNKQS